MSDEFREIIGWLIGLGASSIISIVGAILAWVKAGKMMPREIKGTDLDNKQKEASLAEQYEELAERAVEKSVGMQDRILKLETEHKLLKSLYEEQNETIREQAKRLDAQGIKIEEQEKEIMLLGSELKLAKAYNLALIHQMKEENMMPLEITDEKVKEYEKELENEEKPKRKYTRKNNGQ